MRLDQHHDTHQRDDETDYGSRLGCIRSFAVIVLVVSAIALAVFLFHVSCLT